MRIQDLPSYILDIPTPGIYRQKGLAIVEAVNLRLSNDMTGISSGVVYISISCCGYIVLLLSEFLFKLRQYQRIEFRMNSFNP